MRVECVYLPVHCVYAVFAKLSQLYCENPPGHKRNAKKNNNNNYIKTTSAPCNGKVTTTSRSK